MRDGVSSVTPYGTSARTVGSLTLRIVVMSSTGTVQMSRPIPLYVTLVGVSALSKMSKTIEKLTDLGDCGRRHQTNKS